MDSYNAELFKRCAEKFPALVFINGVFFVIWICANLPVNEKKI